MVGNVTIAGFDIPTSATGNVPLDGFEKFPGVFKDVYETIATQLGTNNDKRIDAEIRRHFNAKYFSPSKAANDLLTDNRQNVGTSENVDTNNLAKELVSMRTKNPEQANAVEAQIRTQLSTGDQSRLSEDLKLLTNQAVQADANLLALGQNASRHIGRVTTVNDLGVYSSRILKDSTHIPAPTGGRSGPEFSNGDTLNVRQVVVTLQDTARADPALAQMLRKEMETRMSPQDRADMNRMLAGETGFGEETVAALENPSHGVVGAGKGFVNSTGDIVDGAVQAGTLKAAVDLEQRASMQALFGNKELASSMFAQAKAMRETAKQEIIPNIPHNNMAQQGGQNIQMIAEFGYAGVKAGASVAKNVMTKADDVAEIAGKQADSIPPKRIFTSSDPHVAETATRLDELFPGRVIGINQNLPANVGGGFREVDIVMDKFIIQVKGGKADKLAPQLHATKSTLIDDSRMVIGYAPDKFSNLAWKGAAEDGLPIARSFDELVLIIKELDKK